MPAQNPETICRSSVVDRIPVRRIGSAYERFLKETVQSGGVIFLVECTMKCPVAHIAERHRFQLGAYKGPPPRNMYTAVPGSANF